MTSRTMPEIDPAFYPETCELLDSILQSLAIRHQVDIEIPDQTYDHMVALIQSLDSEDLDWSTLIYFPCSRDAPHNLHILVGCLKRCCTDAP